MFKLYLPFLSYLGLGICITDHHWLKGIISTSPHAFAHLLTLTSPGCPVQPLDHGCDVLPQHPWHPQTWHCQR